MFTFTVFTATLYSILRVSDTKDYQSLLQITRKYYISSEFLHSYNKLVSLPFFIQFCIGSCNLHLEPLWHSKREVPTGWEEEDRAALAKLYTLVLAFILTSQYQMLRVCYPS